MTLRGCQRVAYIVLAFSSVMIWACEEAKDTSRIAIAGGSLTEIVYLLGLEDRIVATDTTSVYPEAAQSFPSIGYVRALSTEGILSIEPSLLLSEDDAGPPHVIKQLKDLGVEIRTVPEEQTARGIIDKALCVAKILGANESERVSLERILQTEEARLDSIRKQLVDVRATVIFGINDGIPTVGGEGTSGHSLLAMIGLRNSFDNVSGWKPVSLESMVEANPQVLIVPQRALDISGGQKIVIESKSIQMTEAGKKEQFVVADTMALLGFGPRTLSTAADLAEQVLGMTVQE